MASVWQKEWVDVTRFPALRVETCHLGTFPTRRSNAAKWAASDCAIQNHVVAAPRAAAAVRPGQLAQRRRLAPRQRDLLQPGIPLALCKKADRMAVRRPERKRGTVAAFDRPRRRPVEGADPQSNAAVSLGPGERQLSSIGRDCKTTRRQVVAVISKG